MLFSKKIKGLLWTSVTILSFLLILFACNKKTEQEIYTVYVSPSGSDVASGSREAPFASIQRALEEVETQNETKTNCDFVVEIAQGVYCFDQSIEITEDIFSPRENKLVFRGESEVIFSGGLYVPIQDFQPLHNTPEFMRQEAVPFIKYIDLSSYGVTEYPAINTTSFRASLTSLASIEVFGGGKALPLARYPDTGYLKSAGSGDSEHLTSIKTNIDSQKLALLAQQTSGRVNGFFYHDWSSDRIIIDHIDTSGTINSNQTTSYGVRKNARYYIDNFISELDSPGEWYLDRETDFLYLYPTQAMQSISISVMEKSIFNLNNTSNITFDNIIFEGARGDLISIENASQITMINSVFRFGGKRGINAVASQQIVIEDIDIYDMGMEAINLSGGDRKTLRSSENVIRNSTITRIGRQVPSTGAITMTGVGNLITHNLIYDLPHSAIDFKGNDHIISYNRIHTTNQETADSGAIYIGRDFTYGGVRIEFNYIYDIPFNSSGNMGPTEFGMGTTGIYLDDQASGITAYGNIVENCFRGILLGGGKSNTIQNNVIIDCFITILADNRGEEWAFQSNGATMERRLFDQNLDIRNNPLWQERFPYLQTLIAQYDQEDTAGIKAPSNNKIIHNIKCNSFLEMIAPSVIDFGIYEEIQLLQKEDIFVDANNRDYRLKDTAEVSDFEPIPFERIRKSD